MPVVLCVSACVVAVLQAVDEHVELQARGTEVNVFGEFVMMYTGRVGEE